MHKYVFTFNTYYLPSSASKIAVMHRYRCEADDYAAAMQKYCNNDFVRGLPTELVTKVEIQHEIKAV